MLRIDHIVIAVRDLDCAAEVYRKLGFQVGARNRHPLGTENRLIQFGSSFIELISVGTGAQLMPHRHPQFSFGTAVQESLEKREGIAMVVLSSEDARSDAALFADRGIGDFDPFWFSRKGVRPDGSEIQVAFTLAFAHDPLAPDLSFFVCQQHYPGNFWNGQFQQHPNGAKDIASITLTSSKPASHQRFLTAFSGVALQPRSGVGTTFRLDGGCIQLVSAPAQDPSSPSAMLPCFSVRVADLEAVRRLIRRGGIDIVDADEEVVIPPDLLNGVELRFANSKHQ